MKLDHLRTFLAVRKHRNFTRAAEERFLSQPAVSRQVQQLGRELGVSLFEQVGRRVQLTDAGRTLGPLAEELLGNMERVTEAVRRHREAVEGRLRIGASSTPGLYLVPPILGRFHREFPEVELRYTVESSLSIERRLVRNELDLGFMGGRPTTPDLLSRRLADDEIICFCGPSHPLAGQRTVEAASLGERLWVVRGRGSATRSLFEDWLDDAGGALERVIELDSTEAIKRMVEAGVGISFMSRLGLETELQQGRLVRLPVAGLDLVRPLFHVLHARKHPSPVMEAFSDHLFRGTAEPLE